MIGDIIKERRILNNMTRKVLSEEVCTEKYIYLIETNQRTPSAHILDQLSEKLSIDLFEYYQYLNFKNPSLVVEYKKNFERYMQLSNIEALKKESLEASQLEAFKQEPLCYDITIINLLYQSLIEGKTSESIQELTNLLNIKELNIDPLTLINGYIVLSTCYQLEGQLNHAKETLEIVYPMINNKMDFPRYHTVIVNVMISLTSLLHHTEEYEELIKHSNLLIDFQQKYNEYNRIYYADFFLSFGYYQTNQHPKSKEHFLRGIHSASLFENKMDINIIREMKDFSKLVEVLGIDQTFIDYLHMLSE